MITGSEQFWRVFKETPGALSCAEAIAIMNIAKGSPLGTRLELGSHKGKSGMSSISVWDSGEFILVDPIFEDKNIADDVLQLMIGAAGGPIAVHLLAGYSTDLIPKFDNLAYVFLDTGSHGDGLPMREVMLLEDSLMSGGILCFHDYLNQFTEVEGAYNYLVSTGKYDPIKIDWQPIFEYVKENNLEEGNNSWHVYPELSHPPNFVGALKRK